jgi:hypothetical protein
MTADPLQRVQQSALLLLRRVVVCSPKRVSSGRIGAPNRSTRHAVTLPFSASNRSHHGTHNRVEHFDPAAHDCTSHKADLTKGIRVEQPVKIMT